MRKKIFICLCLQVMLSVVAVHAQSYQDLDYGEAITVGTSGKTFTQALTPEENKVTDLRNNSNALAWGYKMNVSSGMFYKITVTYKMTDPEKRFHRHIGYQIFDEDLNPLREFYITGTGYESEVQGSYMATNDGTVYLLVYSQDIVSMDFTIEMKELNAPSYTTKLDPDHIITLSTNNTPESGTIKDPEDAMMTSYYVTGKGFTFDAKSDRVYTITATYTSLEEDLINPSPNTQFYSALDGSSIYTYQQDYSIRSNNEITTRYSYLSQSEDDIHILSVNESLQNLNYSIQVKERTVLDYTEIGYPEISSEAEGIFYGSGTLSEENDQNRIIKGTSYMTGTGYTLETNAGNVYVITVTYESAGGEEIQFNSGIYLFSGLSGSSDEEIINYGSYYWANKIELTTNYVAENDGDIYLLLSNGATAENLNYTIRVQEKESVKLYRDIRYDDIAFGITNSSTLEEGVLLSEYSNPGFAAGKGFKFPTQAGYRYTVTCEYEAESEIEFRYESRAGFRLYRGEQFDYLTEATESNDTTRTLTLTYDYIAETSDDIYLLLVDYGFNDLTYKVKVTESPITTYDQLTYTKLNVDETGEGILVAPENLTSNPDNSNYSKHIKGKGFYFIPVAGNTYQITCTYAQFYLLSNPLTGDGSNDITGRSESTYDRCTDESKIVYTYHAETADRVNILLYVNSTCCENEYTIEVKDVTGSFPVYTLEQFLNVAPAIEYDDNLQYTGSGVINTLVTDFEDGYSSSSNNYYTSARKIELPASKNIKIYSSKSGDSYLYIYKKTVDGYSLVASNDDARWDDQVPAYSSYLDSYLNFIADEDGGDYYIVITDRSAEAGGDYCLTVWNSEEIPVNEALLRKTITAVEANKSRIVVPVSSSSEEVFEELNKLELTGITSNDQRIETIANYGYWSFYVPSPTASFYLYSGCYTQDPRFQNLIIDIIYTCTLTYSGENIEIAPLIIESGEYAGRPETPVIDGYTFGGWFTEETFENSWDFTAQKVTQDTTLYAKWDIRTDYTVVFDDGSGVLTDETGITYNTSINAPVPEPTKTGHTFGGWYTENTFENLWDFSTDKVTQDTTLFAKWDPVSYEVVFAGEATADIDGQTIAYGEPVIEPDAPVRDGYNFGGWFSDDNIFLNQWNFETNVITKDTTLFAKWNIRTDYTVVFDDGSGVLTDETGITYNTSINVPVPEPTKTGHTFGGWYTENTFENLWDFSTDKVTQDTTLFAKWNPVFYEVVFAGEATADIDGQTITYGKPVIEPDAPVRDGYEFKGWFTDDNTFLNQWDFETDVITKDTTLYVKWTKSEATLDNEAVAAAKTLIEEAFENRTTTQAATPDEDAARALIEEVIAGLELNGVIAVIAEETDYTAPVAGTESSNEGTNGSYIFNVELEKGESTGLIENATLIITATPFCSYTVRFIREEEIYESKDIVCGGLAVPPRENPIREGYRFGGWVTDNVTFLNEWNFETDVVTKDTTLYAKWDPVSYEVVFAGEATADIDGQTIAYGKPVIEPDAPARDGYNFGGWFTDNNTFLNQWNFETNVITKDTTLYVKWTKSQATLDNEAVAAAKILIEEAFENRTTAQTATPDEDAARALIEEIIAGLELNGVIAVIAEETDYTAPVAGTEASNEGTNGNYIFNVELEKGESTGLIENATLIITATPFCSYTVRFISEEEVYESKDIACKGLAVPPRENPIREGYRFGGWVTDNVTFLNEWNFETDVVTKDTTLYAKWDPVPYEVVFAGEATADIDGQTIAHGKLVIEPDVPVRDGYEFKGWFTDDNTFLNQWNFETNVITRDTTLYAKWIQETSDEKFEVKFAGEATADIDGQSIAHGKPVIEPDAPVRDGYDFRGWFTDDNTFLNQWDFETDVITKDTTLYAKWTKSQAALDNEDIAIAIELMKDLSRVFSTQVQAPDSVAARTLIKERIADKDLNGVTATIIKMTYTAPVAGTADKPEGIDGKSVFIVKLTKGEGTEVEKELVLIVTATTYCAHTVTFISEDKTIESQDVICGSFAVRPQQNPEREGYNFGGWMTGAQTEWDFATGKITKDTTLVAKWTIRTDYTVVFFDGNSEFAKTPNVTYNTSIAAPVPVKQGYTFGGWFTENTFENQWNFSSDKVTQDTALYVKWNIRTDYIVVFDDGSGVLTKTTGITYNTSITAPVPEPTKAGYTFSGWFTGKSLETPWIFSTDKVTQDTTLFAKWEIRFDPGSIANGVKYVCIGSEPLTIENKTEALNKQYRWKKNVNGKEEIINIDSLAYIPPTDIAGVFIYTREAYDQTANEWVPSLGEWILVVNQKDPNFKFEYRQAPKSVCSGQELTYEVEPKDNVGYEWLIDDENVSSKTGKDGKVTVSWKDITDVTLSVIAKDSSSGCTYSESLSVKILPYTPLGSLNEITVKTDAAGTPYILIYPNPDPTRNFLYQWYYENDPISGADKQFYRPEDGLKGGKYSVYIFESEFEICGSFTESYSKSSLTKSASGELFTVYPNPSDGHFTVAFNKNLVEDNTHAVVGLYSLSGNRLMERKVNCFDEVEFNENLNFGTYLLKIETDNHLIETKHISINK